MLAVANKLILALREKDGLLDDDIVTDTLAWLDSSADVDFDTRAVFDGRVEKVLDNDKTGERDIDKNDDDDRLWAGDDVMFVENEDNTVDFVERLGTRVINGLTDPPPTLFVTIGEVLKAAVELAVITFDIDSNGEAVTWLVFIGVIEFVGVSVLNDAFAEFVELEVKVPVIDCIADFDDETDTVASGVNVFTTLTVAILLPECKFVEIDVSEFDEVDVKDDRGVSLDAAVMVAPVDCETLELADVEKRGVVDNKALLEEIEESDDEPDVLLLNLLVNDFNTERETEGEDDSLRDGRVDVDDFAVTEFDNDKRLLTLSDGDTVLVFDAALDVEGRVVGNDEPDVLLLNLLVNDFNTEGETEGEDDSLRDGRVDVDDFAVTELEDDIRLLTLLEGDDVLFFDAAVELEGRVVGESCADIVWVPLILEDCEIVPEIALVWEYVGDIELEADTRALWDDRMVVEGEELIDEEEDVERLPLTHADTVLSADVSGLDVDVTVGVITAVFNAVRDVDDVIIPVTDMKEVIEGVNVFCEEEDTDTEAE
jgi:hypothetical protein